MAYGNLYKMSTNNNIRRKLDELSPKRKAMYGHSKSGIVFRARENLYIEYPDEEKSFDTTEREVMQDMPFYYRVHEYFMNYAEEFFGKGKYSIVSDGKRFDFSDCHDVLFKGCAGPKNEKATREEYTNYLVETVKLCDLDIFDTFKIEHRVVNGITYLCIDHTNEMLSGCYFKMIATKKGDLHKVLLWPRKFIKPLIKPILDEKDYDDTIGAVLRFLSNRKAIKEMGITANKGLLLWGSPGNGKTMITAYLKEYCTRRGYNVNVVNKGKIARGDLYGDVLIMDDFQIDHLVKRDEITDILLSEMDGPNKEGGRVYIITTNELKDPKKLRAELVRPGRIDSAVKLELPSKSLRYHYVNTWKIKLTKEMIEEIVEKTDKWSFAQLNYLQTEICIRQIEKREVVIKDVIKLCNLKILDNVNIGGKQDSVGFGSIFGGNDEE